MSTTIKYRVAFRKTACAPAQESPTLATVAAGDEPCATGTTEEKERPRRNVGRAARMLALAYLIERKVEAGRLKDYAEAARGMGITRARMAQVMALMNLAPSIQEALLTGTLSTTERRLRTIATKPLWADQSVLRHHRGTISQIPCSCQCATRAD